MARATTNNKGIATFTNLYQNSYVLKEISTNEKYILNKMEFDVNVTYNKTTAITVTKDSRYITEKEERKKKSKIKHSKILKKS